MRKMMKTETTCLVVLLILAKGSIVVDAFNGELVDLGCPDECECHYFRVNWVTDCSESNLTDIPYSELSPSVYILDLNGNYLTDVPPFPPDIKMRRLQLANNLLTHVRKESFQGLNYLIDADFANNRIATIDPSTFQTMSGFISLELQDNPLTSVDGEFLYSSTLLYLDISNCGLNFLNPRFFANVTSLCTLDLSDNPLGMISPNEFNPLKSLEILKMNNCNVSFIGEDAFAALDNLKSFELAGNNLAEISWSYVLYPLIRLEYLDFRRSGIRVIQPDAFDNNTYLRTLILAENELRDLDVAATVGQKLSHLDSLDLSHCHLGRPLSEDAFVNSSKIRTLYLAGNTLFASDLLLALAPLTKLQKLSLSQCGLSVLPHTLHQFQSLTELDISHNPLNDVFVKILAPLQALEYLNMGNSNLTHIMPSTFSKMTSMRRLILSGNDLNSLEAGLFANLTHLKSLELNSCGLRKPLNATVFFNNLTYTDLTELQLAGNPLKVSRTGPLLPKQLSQLRTLDLSNCNLTYLPMDAFYWTTGITHLILKGNQFTSRDFKFLNLLPQLETVDLRYNNLTTFSPKYLIMASGKLNKVQLIGNPWICDCDIVDTWDWSKMMGLQLATSPEEHIIAGKVKNKHLLTCNHYDGQKTWSKYVKDSGCERRSSHFRSARSLIEPKISTNILYLGGVLFLVTIYVMLGTKLK
ncbi:PREDICTED: chaoptin-like [Nicrophorus vespilloides]|uniref:Chaoptin-like n=1 Tax=Nicrophorus vespilloides TaxID=110193 RepID=A0ABM1N041_NICVS|nr:PREDICTED: chaoptin-like [Nicrophorus vespilloides]